MNEYPFQLKDIPITKVSRDLHQPRHTPGSNLNHLKQSIKTIGIQQPLVVRALGDAEEGYDIIDGHRRFLCAQELGYKTVPCIVHKSNLKAGEFERIRFEVQNNRMAWKPMEKSEAIYRIKNTNHLKSNKEIGEFLGISESSVANYLQMRDLSGNIREQMAEYKLSSSYRTGFIRLMEKLRKIRELETDQIMTILFKKVKKKVIRNAKDLRKLSKIFLRATANENEIYKFLTNFDMTIDELDAITVHSGSSLLLEKIISVIAGNLQHGMKLQEKEEKLVFQLGELIEKYKKIKPNEAK